MGKLKLTQHVLFQRKKDKGINKHEDDDIEDKEERKRKNQVK